MEIKSYIAVLSVFVLLFPTIVQSLHTFEDHYHTACVAVDKHHFHEQKTTCLELHFQFEIFSFNYLAALFITSKDAYPLQLKQPKTIIAHRVAKKSPRAPPSNFLNSLYSLKHWF
ncbi:MAG: hypothetical protein ACK5H1_06355 [Tenacibaculum sp.]